MANNLNNVITGLIEVNSKQLDILTGFGTSYKNSVSGVLIDKLNIINDKIDELNSNDIQRIDVSKIKGSTVESAITGLYQKIDNKTFRIMSGIPTSENIFEEYKLQISTDGQIYQDLNNSLPIKIYKESLLQDVYISGNNVVFKYKLYDGTTKEISFNVSSLILESEFKDGLIVSGGIVKVKINDNSDDYISVDENGILLTGVKANITANKNNIEILSGDLYNNISGDIQHISSKIEEININTNTDFDQITTDINQIKQIIKNI